MCTYLTRREARYYFRRPIPLDLQSYFGGRVQWMHSLGTSDPATGKRKAQEETLRTSRELDLARKRRDAGLPPAGLAQPSPAERRLTHEEVEAALARRDEHSLEAAEFFEELYAQQEWELENDPEAARVHDAVQAALAAQEKRLADERRFWAAEARANANVPSPAQVAIKDIFERYAKQPGIRPETVRQFRSIIMHLVAFLGHDDARRVQSTDLVRWRNHLVEAPAVRGKPRSAKTINGSYLAAASVTFAYAADQLAIPVNPMTNVAKVRAARVVRLREKDFTLAERRTILTAAFHAKKGSLSHSHGLARRWVPWLCAYTGARVNEITQLRGDDVRQVDGIWTMHITPEAGNVKTDQARTVPLHEHLIAQGFVAVAMKAGSAPIFYEPSRGRTGMARGHHKRVGMRLAGWIRELGIKDPSVQPNHAWRHTFKTIRREVGMDEGAADYMQGHAQKSIGRAYGSNTLAALVRELAKFPRFEFDKSLPYSTNAL